MQCFLSLVDLFAFSLNVKILSTVNAYASRLVFMFFKYFFYQKLQFLNAAV